MATYLLTWNPNRWTWTDLPDIVAALRRGERRKFRWSTGNRKHMSPGDRLYLLRLRVEPRGIVASGVATSAVYQSEDWAEHKPKTEKLTNYIDFVFDALVDPDSEPECVLAVDTLKEHVQDVDWHPQASGVEISGDSARRVERIWQGLHPEIREALRPDEEIAAATFAEGAVRCVYVDTYERNSAARQACIEHFGTECHVCGFDFESVYGERGAGYIEVHHLKPISEVGEQYEVHPIKDLRPVCPNCHRMIHRSEPMLTPDELRRLTQQDLGH